MKTNNIVFFINSSFLKIPFEACLISQKSSYVISGRLIFPKNSTIKDSIHSLSENASLNKNIEEFIPNLKLTKASLTITPDMQCAEISADGLNFSCYKKGKNYMVVFSLERANMSKDAFFTKVAERLGIEAITTYCVMGTQRISTEGLLTAEKLPTIPNGMFVSNSSLLYAHLNLKNDGTLLPLKIIADLFNLSSIDLIIGCNSQNEWLCSINMPTFAGSLLEAKNLSLSFTVGSNPRFGLSGEFKLKIGDKAMQFKTQSQFESEVVLSASQLDNDVLELTPFKFSQMALELSAGVKTTEIAMCGRIQLRKINVFGALALDYNKFTCIASPKMFSLAVSDITLQEVVESIAGIDIPGDTCLNQISIQGVNIPAGKKAGTPAEIKNDLAIWGNQLRDMVEGTGKVGRGTDNDFVYTLRDNNRISIMDKAYMRHYALIPEGKSYIPQVEAQFIVAKEDIHLGDYYVARGAFVCANIRIFGVQVITFLNIKDDEVTACMIISPIKKAGVLEITGTGKSIEKSSLVAPPAIVKSIINLSSKEKGAICYFSAGKKNGVNLYLDAHINLLSVIQIDANIQISKGMIRIDTSGCMLTVFKYVLCIKCSYGDFENASFSALLAIDTSALKEKFRNVQKKIEDAKRAVLSKKDEVHKKFEIAKCEVNKLNGQIHSFNKRIADRRHNKSRAGFFRKIKYAFQILGLEIARAGVICAIGIAKRILTLAEKVANAPFAVSGLALEMVNAILEGAMNLFYIERFVITAIVGSKEKGFLFKMDFVLLGKHFNVEHKVGSLSGSQGNKVLEDLDTKMSKKSELDSKEIPRLSLSPAQFDDLDFDLEHLAESLKAGSLSVNSAHNIIQNAEALYAEYIDSEMDFVEKEELRATIIQNSYMIKEYAQLTGQMNESAIQALNALNISENTEGLQAKSVEWDGLNDLLLEKKNLLNMMQNIEIQNKSLKDTLDSTVETIERSRDMVKKDHGKPKIVNADWDGFAEKMETMLVKEATQSIGNHYITPGYEPAIIQSIRDYSNLVKKSKIKAPKGYTNRM